ncbi:MAG TPA: gamma-glutamyl-phosphate reductase, partial [Aestuariivirga sp.]
MKQLGLNARAAAKVLAQATTIQKNVALLAMAKAIRAAQAEILAANSKDLDAAKSKDLKSSFVDRL